MCRGGRGAHSEHCAVVIVFVDHILIVFLVGRVRLAKADAPGRVAFVQAARGTVNGNALLDESIETDVAFGVGSEAVSIRPKSAWRLSRVVIGGNDVRRIGDLRKRRRDAPDACFGDVRLGLCLLQRWPLVATSLFGNCVEVHRFK